MLDLTGFNYGDVSIENAARTRVLQELATDLDLHLAEFRDTWPGPVARGADLVQFIDRKMPGKGFGEKVLYRIAAKAGLIVTERLGRDKTRFIITDGKTAEGDIAINPAHWLAEATDAAARFAMGGAQPGTMPGAMPPR
ncbi:hypothetical protein NM680_10025 [Paracoccus sp. PS-1]|uniref:hypothetical protein n=1 Tax=unclassified Paracoccus (in: a-proteobacteria) TaxID=2688777 RepID=UPI0004B14C42|nr:MULTISPECIES: hypothetical protein [unclassified Paracoccus (in: a-proteobacteria)]MDQ7262131.1 hypothetical protein [Paracoccus sp. PS1]